MASSHDVYLGLVQLEEMLTEDEIRQIFCHFGDILYVTVKSTSKTAYIKFAKKKSADLAVKQGENYIKYIRKDIGRIKIGWANTPKIHHAKINNESSSDSDSSSINGAYKTLDAAYKRMTKSSWTCPDPGCRHVNDLEQERCVKCKFSRDFPVAKSKQMLGKGLPATYKGRNGKLNDGNKNVHAEVAALLSHTNIKPGPPEKRKDSLHSSSNIDDEITELQRSCSSLLDYREKAKMMSLNKENCEMEYQDVISIYKNELRLRNNNGIITAEPTSDAVRKAYNFYIQCKDMLEKESDSTSRKNKEVVLDVSVKDLAHKLRNSLCSFPIKELKRHQSAIDSYLEKYPSEYELCVSNRISKDRRIIRSDDILQHIQKLSTLKLSILPSDDKLKDEENITNELVGIFANKLREVAQYFEEFKSQSHKSNRSLSHVQKLPNLRFHLKTAVQNVQKEDSQLANISCLSSDDIMADIETMVQLQEDQEQRCRLYMAHKIMAKEIQKRHPDTRIFHRKLVPDFMKSEEPVHLENQRNVSLHTEPLTECSLTQSKVSFGIDPLNEEDKEVEKILSKDKLMGSIWSSYSKENKKEKLKRLQTVFTPCMIKQSKQNYDENKTSRQNTVQ